MGEARRRDLSDKALAASKSPYCVFCGGFTLGPTADHYPPKAIFSEKRSPEGYVFPACESCNAGSKTDEEWVALLARMDPSGADDIERWEKTARSLRSRFPDVFKKMNGLTSAEKRHISRVTNIPRAEGETFKEMPFLQLPPEIGEAIGRFGLKLSKALHFHHTARIIPSEAEILVRWWTNVNWLKKDVPTELFSMLNGSVNMTRANVGLGDQFNYRYEHSADGDAAMYTAWVRFAFCMTSIVVFDPERMRQIEEELRNDSGQELYSGSGFARSPAR